MFGSSSQDHQASFSRALGKMRILAGLHWEGCSTQPARLCKGSQLLPCQNLGLARSLTPAGLLHLSSDSSTLQRWIQTEPDLGKDLSLSNTLFVLHDFLQFSLSVSRCAGQRPQGQQVHAQIPEGAGRNVPPIPDLRIWDARGVQTLLLSLNRVLWPLSELDQVKHCSNKTLHFCIWILKIYLICQGNLSI